MGTTSKNMLQPPGIQSLRRFLQNELPKLRESPILLIASEPAPGAASHTPIQNASRLVQFTLSQQLGLRTVPSTISSAFPSLQDLDTRRDLLRRTGAASIVAVGSGAAIDLAKALARDNQHHVEQLILVPSTHAAVIASGASHSLLLDPNEETLVPSPGKDLDDSCPINVTVTPLEHKYTATLATTTTDIPMRESSQAMYATLAIVLDASLRATNDPHLDDMIQDLQTIFVLQSQDVPHDIMMDLCYRTGQLLSYGLGNTDRSAPLALAASLIPPLFPHMHILTFWASLVPGLYHQWQSSSTHHDNDNINTNAQIHKLMQQVLARQDWTDIPKLTITDQSKKGFSVPDMALSHIQSNTTVWKSYDMPNHELTKILKHCGEIDEGR